MDPVGRSTMSLDGRWELAHFPAGQHQSGEVLAERCELKWQSAHVPGDVLADLRRAEGLGQPVETARLAELEFHEWWYRKVFEVPEEMRHGPIWLVLDGVDTVAQIFLNGRLVGSTDNMFLLYRFEVTSRLRRSEENVLYIRIESPIRAVREKPLLGCFEPAGAYESLWLRKAPHSYGSAVTPRVLSAGLWRGVRLERCPPVSITGCSFRLRDLSEQGATLEATVDLVPSERYQPGLRLRLTGRCRESRFQAESPAGHLRTDMVVTVQDPHLWWPDGLGSPDLYEVRLELLNGEKMLDQWAGKVGLRTVTVERADEAALELLVNGRRVRTLGAVWLPVDLLHSRDTGRTAVLLRAAKDVGCNALHVWGGGVYESELFYSICDELGLMVWQQIPAREGARYPADAPFLQQVRSEAAAMAARLGNHASLVGWVLPEISGPPELTELVRQTLAAVDPGRLVIDLAAENELKPPFAFVRDLPVSLSKEVSPARARQLPVAKLGGAAPREGSVDSLQEDVLGFFQVEGPDNGDFWFALAAYHAERLKSEIEGARLGLQSGAVWSCLNEPLLQCSHAVVDYELRPKLAYAYAQRAQAPLLLCCRQSEEMALFAASDLAAEQVVEWRVSVYDSYGSKVGQHSGSFTAEADTLFKVCTLKPVAGPHAVGFGTLYLIEYTYGGQKGRNHYISRQGPLSVRTYRLWLELIEPDLPERLEH